MSAPLIIITWLWKTTGWRKGYSAGHVNAIERMLKKYLTIPYEMICITDMPKGINCRTVPLWDVPKMSRRIRGPNCYKRLRLFAPDIHEVLKVPENSRLCSIDIDTIIFRNIDHLFDHDHDFIIKEGMACPYNGSIWMLKAGSRPQVWHDFCPRQSPKIFLNQINPITRLPYIGSDQAWMSYKIPNEPMWTSFNHGVLDYFRDIRHHNNIARNGCVIFFPGTMNPWDDDFKTERPDLHAHYMSFSKG